MKHLPQSMVSHNTLIKRLKGINKKIYTSANNSNRAPQDIILIAVTKNQLTQTWDELLKIKLFNVGENKVQETIKKTQRFTNRNKIKLHLIGHLQKNKVKKAIEIYDVIQTVDSIELAERINRISKELFKKQEIYLQVNTSQDAKKHGFSTKEIFSNAKKITNMKNINLTGIMTIPRRGLTPNKLATVYGETKKIQEETEKTINSKCKNISMGMSNDYEIAIQEGATHIRLGAALFG